MEYTAEAGADGRRALRVGLMQVKGLRLETIMTIVRTREESGAFRSLANFLRRVPIERDEIEALIKCGAFDKMGDEVRAATRPEMLWRWKLLPGEKQRESPRVRPGFVGYPAPSPP